MLESVGKTVGKVLEERMSSPLVSTFIVAWCLWNFKFFVILFSDTSVLQTFRLIDQITFPNWWRGALNAFFGPAAVVALYIYVLPYPAKYVYTKWLTTQKENNELKQSIEDASILTQAEALEMRKKERELIANIDVLQNEINKLKDDLREADRAVKSARTATQEAEAKASSSIDQFDQLTSSLKNPAADLDFKLGNQANANEEKLTANQEDLLLFIGENEGMSRKHILENSKSHKVATAYDLEVLLESNFIERVQEDEYSETHYWLTQSGRGYLVKKDILNRPEEQY